MARYNEILTGRHNRLLTKLFSIKGAAPAPQLSSEIMMAHPMFHGVENRWLESWNRYAFTFGVAAVAAINSTLRIRNPAGSNVVAALEKASGGEAAADFVRIGVVTTNADLVVIATNAANRLDPRQVGFPALVISNSDATHPGSTIATMSGFYPANSMYEFVTYEDQAIPILPGQAVDLFRGTVNLPLLVTFMWRERLLEDSEKSA